MTHDGADRAVPGRGFTRRAALVRGSAITAGVGAAALGSAAYWGRSADDSTSGSALNVRDYGAAGDGAADDTKKIQNAIDAARSTGGIVFFPPGTYLTRRLTLYSRVHLRGSGGDSTVLKLWPGANSAIVESDGFARFSGTRSDGGITLFSVRDLTLDGNKSQNPEGGYGLRIYGYGYEMTEVIAFNCRNDGIVSEWGPAAALPAPSHQMEARLSALRTHDNDGHGINFNGPHDSMFLNCLAFLNGASGFRMSGDSMGTLMVNCHAWGIGQNISFDLAATGISCMNCYADLNGGVGVRISRSECRWIGGLVLGYNHTFPYREIGIQFVPGARPEEPSGAVIDSKIVNCGTAAIDFGAERGLSNVRAVLSQPGVLDDHGNRVPNTGLGWIGTPDQTTQVEITYGLGNTEKNLVVRPAFDLRAQETPGPPGDGTVRIFARDVGGRTQLCALFPSGAVQVIAKEP